MKPEYNAFEFTAFMDRFLKAHPEVLKDQQVGWDIYWNPRKTNQVKFEFFAAGTKRKT